MPVSDEQILSVKRLAHRIANHYNRNVDIGMYDHDDYFQEAMLGCMAASKVFNPNHESKAKFSSYAISRMRIHARRLYLCSGIAEVYHEQYKALSDQDKGVLMHPYSLDRAASNSDGNDLSTNVTLGDLVEDETALDDIIKPINEHDLTKLLKKALAVLNHTERLVVLNYHGMGKIDSEKVTFVAVAKVMGFSRQRAQQIYVQSIDKMRKALGVRHADLHS